MIDHDQLRDAVEASLAAEDEPTDARVLAAYIAVAAGQMAHISGGGLTERVLLNMHRAVSGLGTLLQ